MCRSGATYGLGRSGERATYGCARRCKVARDGLKGRPARNYSVVEISRVPVPPRSHLVTPLSPGYSVYIIRSPTAATSHGTTPNQSFSHGNRARPLSTSPMASDSSSTSAIPTSFSIPIAKKLTKINYRLLRA
jgi:hypothetical protein